MRHLERAARERRRQMTVVVAWWTRCRGGDPVGWIFHLAGVCCKFEKTKHKSLFWRILYSQICVTYVGYYRAGPSLVPEPAFVE